MNPTIENSIFSLDSNSSSVYSDDGMISEANSTGTQVHHRSHLQPNIDGMPREYGQYFERSSNVIMPSNADGASQMDASERTNIDYHFETSEEAEERRRRSAALAREETTYDAQSNSNLHATQTYMQQVLAGGNGWNVNRERLGQSSQDQNDELTNYDSDRIGPRPPTPPRRRPRITSTGGHSIGSYRNTVSSIGSIAASSLIEPRDPADICTNETATGPGRQRDRARTIESMPGGAEPSSPPVLATTPVFNHSADDLDSLGLASSRRQRIRANTLHALSGPAPDTHIPIVTTHSGHGRSRISHQGSQTLRRHGKADWRDDLTIEAITQTNSSLVSATGKVYGRGDLSAGYCSGQFVTNLQRTSSRDRERRKGKLKRLFCF